MKRFVLGLVLASAATAPAVADTFDYTFTSSINTLDDFTYQSPSLISTATSFTPLTCEACTGAFVDPGSAGIVRILFGPNTSEYDGLPASFFAVGDHSAFGGALQLDIVDVPATTATPEPSSVLLLGTGVVGMIGMARRRNAKRLARA